MEIMAVLFDIITPHNVPLELSQKTSSFLSLASKYLQINTFFAGVLIVDMKNSIFSQKTGFVYFYHWNIFSEMSMEADIDAGVSMTTAYANWWVYYAMFYRMSLGIRFLVKQRLQ